MSIELFRGDNAYLSNMFILPVGKGIVVPDGREVPCVEIAYLAERFSNPKDRDLILSAKNGHWAKSLSEKFKEEGHPVNDSFDNRLGKIAVMRVLIAQKFEKNPDLAQRLLDTGDQEIVEGNTWNDKFWGVSPVGSRDGQNHLGRILMEERQMLRREPNCNSSL